MTKTPDRGAHDASARALAREWGRVVAVDDSPVIELVFSGERLQVRANASADLVQACFQSSSYTSASRWYSWRNCFATNCRGIGALRLVVSIASATADSRPPCIGRKWTVTSPGARDHRRAMNCSTVVFTGAMIAMSRTATGLFERCSRYNSDGGWMGLRMSGFSARQTGAVNVSSVRIRVCWSDEHRRDRRASPLLERPRRAHAHGVRSPGRSLCCPNVVTMLTADRQSCCDTGRQQASGKLNCRGTGLYSYRNPSSYRSAFPVTGVAQALHEAISGAAHRGDAKPPAWSARGSAPPVERGGE
jgi:hypothetical protein